MSSSKYRRSCDACQRRHLKCNLEHPCKHCAEAGRRCVEASKYQFRNNEDPDIKSGRNKRPKGFSKRQPWTDVPKNLQYVIETPESIVDSPTGDNGDEAAEAEAAHYNNPISADRTPEGSSFSPTSLDQTGFSLPPILSPDQPSMEGSLSLTLYHDPRRNDPLPLQGNLWPVATKEEGLILRHFATELSIWFDYLDERKHFSTVVVQAAATSPALYFAILAVSSKHLNLTGRFDRRNTPDRYQLECIKILIPALSDPNALSDENLFAATILLRLFDEMTEREDGEEGLKYVVGTHLIVEARRQAPAQTLSTTPSSLRFAVLNIELRQEVHIAFLKSQPVTPIGNLLQNCDIDRTLNPTSDWKWAWRMIAHCADTLTYCNGDGPKTLERWKELLDYLNVWENAVPSSFTPFYQEERDLGNGKPFPELLFANDCHAGGHQYQSIARILLLAHDPRIPTLGPDRVVALQEQDHNIKEQVLRICGIAHSNGRFRPVTFCAGIAIAMCGERFTVREEQEALMHILIDAEQHLQWQSFRASERLKIIWAWT